MSMRPSAKPKAAGKPHVTSRGGESDREYVLGTHDEELERLGLQHHLWRGHTHRLWEHARFGPGMRLLDVGCGPGFATADLAQLVGRGGRVTAVDVSQKFVEHVRSRGLPNVEAQQQDVMRLALPSSRFDGAYARWVLCFVPDPQRVIDRVAAALRPGGRFAIQDYYNYRAIKLAPRSEIFERVVTAVDKSWRMHGGDPDIGCRLPGMLERSGLKVRRLEPVTRLARPSDPLWHWPTTFLEVFVPSLVKMKLLTERDRRAMSEEWSARTRDPHAFFTSPPLVEIVAEKA